MKELSERQKLILSLVIHEYTRKAAPVGSKSLVSEYGLDISSATIRNEMSVLTDLGYLRQPHTSAGRTPTEIGFRYFVEKLIHKSELPDNTRHMISHQFYQANQDIDVWMRLAASILAFQSQAASIVTAPHSENANLKHVELISTRGRQVLMVLVLVGGEIHQRIVTVDELVDQPFLSTCANHVNNAFHGMDVSWIKSKRHEFSGFEAEVIDWIINEMDQSDSFAAGEIFLDGMTNVLAEPEFSESEDARRALRVLEEGSLLQDLLSRTILTGKVGGIQVLIGGEGTWDDLSQCSIVLARYGAPGMATGTIGVLGPMRMSYAHTISTVSFMSGLLSDLISELLVE
ncbi:MAG: heat-inducible transcription repressor HrcA [Anaerolineaceae bacterium]|nr:heat-inducible transcription repressor HrcA [Anaerolineaceae bacterium]